MAAILIYILAFMLMFVNKENRKCVRSGSARNPWNKVEESSDNFLCFKSTRLLYWSQAHCALSVNVLQALSDT